MIKVDRNYQRKRILIFLTELSKLTNATKFFKSIMLDIKSTKSSKSTKLHMDKIDKFVEIDKIIEIDKNNSTNERVDKVDKVDGIDQIRVFLGFNLLHIIFILLLGTEGGFCEDSWLYLKINGTVFRNSKGCTRCAFTTVNPDMGKTESDGEPLKTLKAFR